MPENPPPQKGAGQRGYNRYLVDLNAIAVRLRNRLLPLAPTKVVVTIKDISQVALRWHSKENFYRGELIGLGLQSEVAGLALRCVVRVFRTRRIGGQYEVVGFFLKVVNDEGADSSAPAETAADASDATPDDTSADAPADTTEQPSDTPAEATADTPAET